MQTAIFVDCIERYKAYYGVRLAEILPKLIRQKALEQSEPLRELFELFVEKENSPYGYAGMTVSHFQQFIVKNYCLPSLMQADRNVANALQ